MTTCDMRYWRIAPDPRLRGVVSCYWVVDSQAINARLNANEPTEDLLIPDGLSEIVFNRGSAGFERWRLGEPENRKTMAGSYIIGGRSHSVNTYAGKPLRLAGVKLDSRFLRSIIRTPLNEFRESTLSFADLGDSQLHSLENAVGNARVVEAMVALFDNFFLTALKDLQRTKNAVDGLVGRIQADGGATPILEWAREHEVDSRSLERRFCAEVGMTPKQYARVVRFTRHYQALIAENVKVRRSLSANLDGFYDQSHFNREFRYFTGVSPSTKLAGAMSQGMKVADHLVKPT